MFRRPGEERTLDPELRTLLELVWGALTTAGDKMRTSTVLTRVYDANPVNKRLVKSAGGARGLLRLTPSLELETPTGGGDNFIRKVPGELSLRFHDSVLGEQLRLGKLVEVSEESGQVNLTIHEYARKNEARGWDSELVPLYLHQGTGETTKGAPDQEDVDPIVHRFPQGYLQFFVDVEPTGPLRLTQPGLQRLQGIHAIVQVVRGLEGPRAGQGRGGRSHKELIGLVVNSLVVGGQCWTPGSDASSADHTDMRDVGILALSYLPLGISSGRFGAPGQTTLRERGSFADQSL